MKTMSISTQHGHIQQPKSNITKTDTTDKKPIKSNFCRNLILGFTCFAALSALIIGIYFLINSTQTPTLNNTTCKHYFILNRKNNKNVSFRILAHTSSLGWQTMGITVAGTGGVGTPSDRLYNPYGIIIDSSNSLYVADYNNNRIQKFTAGNNLGKTIAGQPNGMNGTNANELNRPSFIILDSNQNLYVSDTLNHRVQFFLNGSYVGTTVAGTGM